MQTLFDNRKARAVSKPARVPAWVVRELTDVHGLDARAVRRMPSNVAFARLFAARRKSMVLSPSDRAAARLDAADRLRRLVADEGRATQDVTDLCVEAMALLDCRDLDRVAAGLAKLLTELAA